MLLSVETTSIIILILFQQLFASQNLTEFMNLRQKRSIIYQGGSIKFSVAGIWPLYLEDPINWRQVNCIGTLQSQYDLPSKPLNSLSLLNNNNNWELPFGKNLRSMREEFDKFDKFGSFMPDLSRMFTYAALEEYMNRNDRNGRECLLRSICENAQIDEHVNDFSRILDVILTPGKENLDEVYTEAVKAGKFGADCMSLYSKCSQGDSFLDRIAVVT